MPRLAQMESDSFQFEQTLNSNSYRECPINKQNIRQTIPFTSYLNRFNPRNKSALLTFNQLIDRQKDSFALNRTDYRLRIKSDLNIDTLKETQLPQCRYYQRTQSHTLTKISSPSKTKLCTQQSTPTIMPTNAKKPIVNNRVHSIEGNPAAVVRDNLIRRPTEYFDNLSTLISNNHSTNELKKAHSILLDPVIKQPQILSEYQYNTLIPSRTPSQAYRYRIKEKIKNIDQQSSILNFPDSRLKPLREKSAVQSAKQVYICNKLNINNSFHSESTEVILPLYKQPSARFIFPFTRSCGYLTNKSFEDLPRLIQTPTKKKHENKQNIINESFEQISIHQDGNSQSWDNIIRSMISLPDFDDDLPNPPNTCINDDLDEEDRH